jgi:DNA repair exonuclease SbcCD ATPase subunit
MDTLPLERKEEKELKDLESEMTFAQTSMQDCDYEIKYRNEMLSSSLNQAEKIRKQHQNMQQLVNAVRSHNFLDILESTNKILEKGISLNRNLEGKFSSESVVHTMPHESVQERKNDLEKKFPKYVGNTQEIQKEIQNIQESLKKKQESIKKREGERESLNQKIKDDTKEIDKYMEQMEQTVNEASEITRKLYELIKPPSSDSSSQTTPSEQLPEGQLLGQAIKSHREAIQERKRKEEILNEKGEELKITRGALQRINDELKLAEPPDPFSAEAFTNYGVNTILGKIKAEKSLKGSYTV